MGANQNPLSLLGQAGLSDFGLSAPSDSNSNSADSEDGANVPDLERLLSSSVLDAEEKAKLAEAQMADLEGASTGGLKDQLFSKRGLMLAALAGGSLAAGQPDVALGIGIGGLEQAAENVGMQKTALKNAKEEALAARDKALSRADKERNRLATMFNTNPEAFVNPETGESVVDPQALGYLLTGTDIPIHPTTRRVMSRRDAQYKGLTGLYVDALAQSGGPIQTRQITNQMFSHLGDRGQVPDEVKASIATAYGTPQFEKEFASTIFRYGGQSGLDAAIEAGRRGVPLYDPDILSMINFSNGDVMLPSQQLNARFIELSDKVRRFQLDPNNAQLVSALRKSSESTTEFNRALVEQALPLTDEQLVYFDKTNLQRDMSFDQWQAMFNDARGKYSLIDTVSGAQALGDLLDLPANEREKRLRDMAAGVAVQTHDAQIDEAKTLGSNSVAASIAEAQAKLVSAYQVSDVTAGAWARDFRRQTVNKLGPDATPEQVQAEYDRVIIAFVDQANK